jgi:response regulator NasT
MCALILLVDCVKRSLNPNLNLTPGSTAACTSSKPTTLQQLSLRSPYGLQRATRTLGQRRTWRITCVSTSAPVLKATLLKAHAPKTQPPAALRIVVVAPDLVVEDPSDDHARNQAERSRALRIGLLESGFNLIATLPADVFLADRIHQLQPDLIIVDAESEARDALEHVVFATRDARRPIVLFTDDNDTTHVRDAVAVGVSAYIVDGLSSTRIRPILDVAMARFDYEERLRFERDDARSALQERTVVDRAKALLMERQGLSEKEAFTKLRKIAMDKGLKLSDIAQRTLDMADLLS